VTSIVSLPVEGKMKRPHLSRRNFLGTSIGCSMMIPSIKNGLSQHNPDESKKRDEIKSNMSKWDIDTPALLIDMDAMERNIRRMSDYCRANDVGYRPHTKTTKCPEIARMQLAAGAVGMCTAKVSEAEALIDAGITNILITSPVITPFKIDRLMQNRMRAPSLMTVADNLQNVRDLSEAARGHQLELGVLVDLNVGQDRTGVEPGQAVVDFAKEILSSDGLRFLGIQAYAGSMQHVHGFEERRTRNSQTMAPAAETVRMLEAEGIPVEIFTGGGTGTYNMDHHVLGFTDGQPGSYVFMDTQYLAIGGQDTSVEHYRDFEPSLTVLTTAISKPVEESITVDAGTKATAMDDPTPLVKGVTGVSYSLSGDEHGKIALENPSREIKLGDKLELIITHCDPAVNLYDQYHCIRDDRLEAVWEITGRGKSQ
jgi:D-serine deaminase-like pyridoxal phosphate-dependent protein